VSSKAERLGAGTLLLHESKLNKTLTGAVRDSIASSAGNLQYGRRGETLRKGAILLAIVHASKVMAGAVYPHIVAGRAAVRAASRARLSLELKAAGVTGFVLGATGGWRDAPLAEEDHARATMASDGLALGWRSVALAMLLQGMRKDEAPAKSIEKTNGLMAARIRRTAATETSTAYNSGRLETLRDESAHNAEFHKHAKGLRLMRQWSALADACSICLPLHGSLATMEGSFESGLEPGDAHVHCRCMFIVVPVSKQEYSEAA
jgi:hypothetical protein